MIIFVFVMIKNIVVKGEHASYQHFLLFPECFHKALYLGSLRVGTVYKELKQ